MWRIFSKGLMCLNTSGNYTQVEILIINYKVLRQESSLITLAPVSYLRSLVVRAVHRHRTGVGSIPAGGPYS